MISTPALPTQIKQALTAALVASERVRWAAQPSARRMTAAFGIYLFAIPWTAFALFWESMAVIPFFAAGPDTPMLMKYGFGIVFPLFGLPFIAAGAWMLYQPIRAMRKAARTVHAVTDRRVMTLVVDGGVESRSVFVDRIGPIERKQARDGWGSLRIETHSRIDSDGDRITERFEMIGIPDVARVEQLLIKGQNEPS